MKLRLFLKIIPLICACVMACYSVQAQPIEEPKNVEAPKEQLRMTLPPLTDEQVDLFLDSLRSSIPLRFPPPHESQRVDSNISGLFAGSQVKISTDISRIVLRFRRRTEDLLAAANTQDYDPNTLLESFDVTINLSDSWLELQHSNPELRRDFDGFRIRLDRKMKESMSPFVRGQKESAVYYGIPPYSDASELFGILVCPRRVTKATLAGGLSGVALLPSPYELSEVMIMPDAKAEAVMSTAGQLGKTGTYLELTDALPPSRFFEDVSISSMPRAGTYYKPISPIDFFRYAPANAVQQGILMRVEMTNKAGYQRVQRFGEGVFIRKFQEPPPINVVADGKRVASDNGDCYIVVDHRYSWVTYEKLPSETALRAGE